LISQRQAAVVLGLSDRQVRRLKRRYECEGAAGLVSRGRPSNRSRPKASGRRSWRVCGNATRLGELVQIDGSLHDWFEGRGPRCCLIAFIDDATSRVMAARLKWKAARRTCQHSKPM